MKTMNQRLQNSGGILLIAILFIGSLAALSIAVMTVVRNKSRQAYQTSGWQEALSAAESGVDVGIGELMAMIEAPNAAFLAAKGWEHSSNTTYAPKDFWDPSPGDLGYSSAPVADQQWRVSTGLAANSGNFDSTVGRFRKVISGAAMQKEGMGGSKAKTVIIVDTTENLKDDSEEYWYRIRAIGIAEIPGGAITAGEGRATTVTTVGGVSTTATSSRTMDNELRRMDLRMNHRTNKVVEYPQASRIVEAIAKPISAFDDTFHTSGPINLNNANVLVDSYDSGDPLKSDNGSWPENYPTRIQKNANIATNGELIDAGGATIKGNAATNGGAVLNASNVTGEITNDFYQPIYPVAAPIFIPNSSVSGTINSNTTIAATAGGTNVNLTGINLSGSKKLTVTGAANGSKTYVTIVVNGDISTSGNGEISLGANVFLRLFVSGDVTITGNGFVHSGTPKQMQLYGTAPLTNADGTPAPAKTMKIAGNGAFHGTVYAPNYDLELRGGGSSNDSVCGAFVCKSVFMNGVTSVHYDEALQDSGLVTSYQVATWYEDIR